MSTNRTGAVGTVECEAGSCRPKARCAEAFVSTTMPSESTIRIGAWFESKRSRYMASAWRWASRDDSARRRAASLRRDSLTDQDGQDVEEGHLHQLSPGVDVLVGACTDETNRGTASRVIQPLVNSAPARP